MSRPPSGDADPVPELLATLLMAGLLALAGLASAALGYHAPAPECRRQQALLEAHAGPRPRPPSPCGQRPRRSLT